MIYINVITISATATTVTNSAARDSLGNSTIRSRINSRPFFCRIIYATVNVSGRTAMRIFTKWMRLNTSRQRIAPTVNRLACIRLSARFVSTTD